MIRTFALLFAVAAAAASIDLVHEAIAISGSGSVAVPDRSTSYLIGLAALSVAWSGAIALTQSPSIAFSGGLRSAARWANLAPIALWPSLASAATPRNPEP